MTLHCQVRYCKFTVQKHVKSDAVNIHRQHLPLRSHGLRQNTCFVCTVDEDAGTCGGRHPECRIVKTGMLCHVIECRIVQLFAWWNTVLKENTHMMNERFKWFGNRRQEDWRHGWHLLGMWMVAPWRRSCWHRLEQTDQRTWDDPWKEATALVSWWWCHTDV